ncbi:hypothetical protein SDC9_95162 [bioreactor metagenome]|uniref:Lipoprotein n=1 Tax=bioreactor metagenome TaxID=1076179 RepID=A0A645A5R9_9ZZZZ
MRIRLFSLILITSLLLIACKGKGVLTLWYPTTPPEGFLNVVDGKLVIDSTKVMSVKTVVFTNLKSKKDTIVFTDTLSQLTTSGVSFVKEIEIQKKSKVSVYFEYSDGTVAFLSFDKFTDSDVFIINGPILFVSRRCGIGFIIRQFKKHESFAM